MLRTVGKLVDLKEQQIIPKSLKLYTKLDSSSIISYLYYVVLFNPSGKLNYRILMLYSQYNSKLYERFSKNVTPEYVLTE